MSANESGDSPARTTSVRRVFMKKLPDASARIPHKAMPFSRRAELFDEGKRGADASEIRARRSGARVSPDGGGFWLSALAGGSGIRKGKKLVAVTRSVLRTPARKILSAKGWQFISPAACDLGRAMDPVSK